jgi:hypothetical protein
MNTIAVPLTLILFLFVLIYTTRQKRKEERKSLPDNIPAPDVITPVELTGRTIFLSNEEKEIWKGLNNAQKKAIIDNQTRNIKSGTWVKVFNQQGDCTGIITRQEAISKGLIK